MTRTVLVAVDGTSPSEAAVEYGAETFPDSDLRLLHVVDPYGVGYDTDGRDPERLLADLAAVGEVDGKRPTTAIRVGRPAREILAYAAETDVDEIVVGSHGREWGARVLLGSVAERVTRRAPVPVTIVRAGQRTGTRRLLVAIDGSPQSDAALSYALSTFPDAEITVLHAIDPMETHFGEGQLAHTEDEYERIRADAERLLAEARETAAERGVDVETVTAIEGRPNSPADAVLGYVDEADVDHVVVGSHGRSGATRVLLGSVAETIARRSPSPVTVVR